MIVNPNSVGPQPYQPHGLIPSSTSSVGQPEDQPTMLEAALGFTDAVSLSPEAAEPVALDLNPTCEIEPSIVEAWQLPDVSEQAVTFLQGLRESIQADTSVPASVRNDFIEILDQKIVELGDLEGSPAEVNAATEQILDQVGQEYLALSPVIVGARNKISQLNGLMSQDNLPDEVREQLTGIRNSLRAFVQSFLEGDLEAAQTHLDRANQLSPSRHCELRRRFPSLRLEQECHQRVRVHQRE